MTQAEARKKYIEVCTTYKDHGSRCAALKEFDAAIGRADEAYWDGGKLYTIRREETYWAYNKYPSGYYGPVSSFTEYMSAKNRGEPVTPDGSTTTDEDYTALEQATLSKHPEYFEVSETTPVKYGDHYNTLGRIYHVLSYAARKDGANMAELQQAGARPLKMIDLMHSLALKLHKLTPAREKQLAQLYSTISPDGLHELQGMERSHAIPADQRSCFVMGYALGMAGWQERSKIAVQRRKKCLTQKQLGAEIGSTQVDVSRWESGKVKPGADKLSAIANALDCSIDDLI